MDWAKLNRQQILEFLDLYKVTPDLNNLPKQAQQLFNQVVTQFGNRAVFTEAVIDLYLASDFRGNIPQKYTPTTIRNLSPQQLQQFAAALNLPIITPERLIRILGFLNALDLTSPISDLPTEIDYLVALNLDYISLMRFCDTSIKHARMCEDNNFWKIKAEHDFHVDPQTFNEGKIGYLKLAAKLAAPIPGAEKYIHYKGLNYEGLGQMIESAFKTGDQSLIDYFSKLLHDEVLAYMAGKYANAKLINNILSQEDAQKYAPRILAGAAGAAEGGQQQIINQMMQLGIKQSELIPAIDAAAKGGHISIMNDMILKSGTTPTSMTLDYLTAVAAQNGHLNVIQDLVRKGATNLNEVMMIAAERGYLDIVNEMIKDGATDINKALIIAIESKHPDIVEKLLQSGASLDRALHMVSSEQREMILNEIKKRNL